MSHTMRAMLTCRKAPRPSLVLAIVASFLGPLPTSAQLDSQNTEALPGQIISLAMPPVPDQLPVGRQGAGKRIPLGMPTTSQYQSSRSGGDALGFIYTPNPELRSLLPDDFVTFTTPTGEVFELLVSKSRITRFGNVEISGGDESASFSAIVTKSGDFIADIETNTQTYRAFVGDGLTFVFSSEDPVISKGVIADDAPLDELLKRPASLKRVEVPPSPKLGSKTVIALGILLDDYWWSASNTTAMLDYYIGQLNSAYQLADVDIRFEISAIGKYEPYKEPYATSGDLGPTLNWISCGTTSCGATDGVNTTVDNWRTAKKLDVVTQFLQNPAVTTPNEEGSYSVNWGIARLPMSDVNISSPAVLKHYTYSVNGIYNPYNGYPAGKYLIAHEIGHNFGLWHDRQTLESQLEESWTVVKPYMRYSYGIGHRFGEDMGTTMSYADENVNKLSTPYVSEDGIPIGVSIGQTTEAFSAFAVANVMTYYRDVFNNTPSAPSVTNVAIADEAIQVYFSAGASGGLAITGYTATCSDGVSSFQASGTSSPITVSGLTNGVSYTCSVVATNPDGSSASSVSSDPVSPEATLDGLPIWLLYEASK